ncbi:helix-turn-helix transcriptional regulator [Micromonospora sp. 4G57]|uniref:Helix-turn-helix transcriptional regulator n=1 Tax=Micromonospora sicca TaxID=2202420 RepID=A0ABU5JAJ5_9ACTN|nr:MULTISPECIES: helix-turn-helix transcriptional regulator [unclassified Micromonospora]MDZ5443869.1 helix-turn-helix transcriptional regulator [Micromonospora sp. 4G57]MDZ5489613.1 helix-turn-helix transcriptional regulator [Micromonospora sp. 4G53]
MLESLGITSRAEQVYRAMLALPDLGVVDLATHLGIDEATVRAALDELADLALLRPSSVQPGSLRPVSPEIGLAALLGRAEAEVLHRQRQVEATRAAIKSIAAEQLASRDHEGVRRYEDVDAVRFRLEELAANAEVECVSLNPGSAQAPDGKESSKPLNQLALERGVTIRCVYQDSYRNDPGVVGYARWLTGLGGQVRTAPTLPMLMVVVDQRVALLPLDPTDSGKGAVEVVHPGVVAAIYALFEQIWRTARPIDVVPQVDGRGMEPSERELLRILADGHTDEVAARKLGLSLRTVRRMTANVMERLGARSRFQAGVHAAQRGWCDQPG